MEFDTTRRAAVEFFGTFWLTFGGCGAAVLVAAFLGLGIGFLGVSFAFGFTVLTWPTPLGICGGHFNPAVNPRSVVGWSLRQQACPALHCSSGGRRNRGPFSTALKTIGA